MHQDSHTLVAAAQEKRDVNKGWSDSILLRYMARRLHLTLRQVEQTRSLRRTRFQVYTLKSGESARIALPSTKRNTCDYKTRLPLSVSGARGRSSSVHPLFRLSSTLIRNWLKSWRVFQGC
jgi:hypothetical protein